MTEKRSEFNTLGFDSQRVATSGAACGAERRRRHDWKLLRLLLLRLLLQLVHNAVFSSEKRDDERVPALDEAEDRQDEQHSPASEQQACKCRNQTPHEQASRESSEATVGSSWQARGNENGPAASQLSLGLSRVVATSEQITDHSANEYAVVRSRFTLHADQFRLISVGMETMSRPENIAARRVKQQLRDHEHLQEASEQETAESAANELSRGS